MARKLVVNIVGDASSLERSFRRASHSTRGFERDIGKAGRGAIAASLSFRGLGRSVAFASSSFLGGAGIVFAFKSIVREASSVQEETEKTAVVFGRNAKQVQAWAKTLAQSFGVSEAAALKATGTFGNMLRPLGFGEQAAAKMSERLVTLAADMASFNNVKPDVVLQALSGGLAGQVRPLRQYGVFLTAARIQTEAYDDGLAKVGAKLTTAQKLQASYNIILKDTKNAQGDVARNTSSLSVAQSKLSAGIADLEARLGTLLLPVLTKYVNEAAKWLNQSKNQDRITRDVTESVQGFATALRGAHDVLAPVVKLVGGLKNAVELLVIAMAVGKVTSWTNGIRASGTAAETAAGRVRGLRGALLGLPEVVAITVGLDLVMNAHTTKSGSHRFSGKGGFANLFKDAKANPLGALADATNPVLAAADILTGKVGGQAAKNAKEAGRQIGTAFLAGLTEKLGRFVGVPAKISGGAILGGLPMAKGSKFIGRGLTPREQLAKAISDASLTPGTRDDRAALVALRAQQQRDLAFAAKAIAEKRGNTAKFLEQYKQLASDVEASNSAIAQIDSDIASKTKAHADKVRKAAEKAAAAQRRIVGDAIRAAGGSSDVRVGIPGRIGGRSDASGLVQAAQFRALGLTATGDALAPTRKALQAGLAGITKNLGGTLLDTDKNRNLIARIRKVLSGQFGALTRETRLAIKGFEDALKGDKHSGNLTKFKVANTDKVLAGLGLSPDEIRRLRPRLAQIGAGGTVPRTGPSAFGVAVGGRGGGVVIRGDVHVHGVQDPKGLLDKLQRLETSSATQTRGVHPGRRAGLA